MRGEKRKGNSGACRKRQRMAWQNIMKMTEGGGNRRIMAAMVMAWRNGSGRKTSMA
jgi:hypothetical protein